MNRRDFLRTSAAASVHLALPGRSRVFALSGSSDEWLTFEVTTRVEVLKPVGRTRVWLPAAMMVDSPFQKTLANRIDAPGGTAKIVGNEADALGIVAAEFPSGTRPSLTLTSRVSTRNYAVDLSMPPTAHAEEGRRDGNRQALDHFLRSTRLLPTRGIVRTTAREITRSAKNDVEKARAIYEWVVDNTFRKPQTQGCGVGDIRFMLDSKDLGGKCADLNALYVGLARAAGLPARDVYGIRVAPSALGFKSLGTASENVTKSQHCRAEVHLTGYGWVPVDPADVRKVMLEEPPGNRRLEDPMVKSARARLFGSWEMNWVAFNFAHDVVLPGSNGAPVGFLMYPQAETEDGRLDSLEPETFKYEITSRQVRP
jgi:transglutaminase-like putative cysteine protease